MKRPSPALLQALLLLALGLGGWSAAPSQPTPAGAQGFGRWEIGLRQCRMAAGRQSERPCNRLRLEQNLEGLLSVRFVGEGEGGRLASEELSFAGVLPEGQKPMQCRPDGRCQDPPQPLQLLVGHVAWARFNDRGLVDSLPQARLARGQCRLERQTMHCEAREDAIFGGLSWRATAQLAP